MRPVLLVLCAFAAVVIGAGQVQAQPINGLAPANKPYDGTEVVPCDQDGATKQCMATDIAATLGTVGTSGTAIPLLSTPNTWGALQTFPTLTLTPGTAPASPANGQLWATTSGFYGEVGGATVGPFGTGGGSGGTPMAITRAQIGSTAIGSSKTVVVDGYRTAGDLGAGAAYSSVNATSTGLGAIQDSNGVWFNLVLTNIVNPGWFGAYGDDGAHTITSSDISANPWWRGTYAAGETWDYVATQEAIYAVAAGTSAPGAVVWNSLIPSGANYALNKTLTVPNATYGINHQLLLVGSHLDLEFANRNTCWDWLGPSTTSEFFTDSISYAYVKDICLTAEATTASAVSATATSISPAMPLWDMDYDGTYGGLKTQNVTIVNGTFSSNVVNGREVAVALSGGAAQGSTITFLNAEFTGFAPEDCLYVGGTNALNIDVINSDFIGCSRMGVSIGAGQVDVYGSSFEGEGTYLGFWPQVSQYATFGGDVDQWGGTAGNPFTKIMDTRSESPAAVNCPYPLCVADNVNALQADASGWYANYGGFLPGQVAEDGANDGRLFVMVSDGGPVGTNGGWFPITPNIAAGSPSFCTLTDSTQSWTTNQWAGYQLDLAYSNGYYAEGPFTISSNTATSLTFAPCFGTVGGDPLTNYHIAGKTGSTKPNFSGLAEGSSTQGWNANATGYGFSTTAGSTTVTLVGATSGMFSAGQYLAIPDGDVQGCTGGSCVVGQAATFYTAEITAVSLSGATATLTMDHAPTRTLSYVFGYWGTPLTDGQVKWMDLDFNCFLGTFSITKGQCNAGKVFHPGQVSLFADYRSDWLRPIVGGIDQATGYVWQNIDAGGRWNQSTNIITGNGTVDLSAYRAASDIIEVQAVGAPLTLTFNIPPPSGFTGRMTLVIDGESASGEPIIFGSGFSNVPPTTSAGTSSPRVLNFVATSSGWAELEGRTLPAPVTVSQLPTCNASAEGLQLTVSDAASPAWNTALTGGGSTYAGALCNGSAWVAR